MEYLHTIQLLVWWRCSLCHQPQGGTANEFNASRYKRLYPVSTGCKVVKCSDCFVFFCFSHTAVHCNLSQNGIDHQMCPEDMTSQLEEDEESVDSGPVLLDDDSPGYQDVSPPMYQRRSPPHRSVSESELTRVRPICLSFCLSVVVVLVLVVVV